MPDIEPTLSIDPSPTDAARLGVGGPEPASRGSWVTSFVRTWVPLAVVIALLAIAVRFAARPLDDPDLWWHLLAGDGYVFQSWSLANPPPLTPFATVPWFSRSWLLEVAVAPVHDVFGLPGVAWVYGLGLVAVILATYISCRQWGAPLASAVAALVAIVGASASMTERPQLFGYILLVIVTSAWLKAAQTRRPPWWILAVMWLWSASHGTWIAGAAIGLGVVVGMVLDGSLTTRELPRWFMAALGGFAVGALSPVGLTNLVAFLEVRGFQQYITEFVPPSLQDFDMLAALVLLSVVTVPALTRRSSLTWVQFSVLAQGTFWILYTVRSVAWGALMIAPHAAASIHTLMGGEEDVVPDIHRSERLVLVMAGLSALLALAVFVPQTSEDPGGVPLAFDRHLAALPEGTTVLNAYALGGWIEWRHPQLAPVIDGNTNGYRPSDLEDHRDAVRAVPGWREYTSRTDAHVAVLERDTALGLALEERLGWELVAEDDTWILLRDPGWRP